MWYFPGAQKCTDLQTFEIQTQEFSEKTFSAAETPRDVLSHQPKMRHLSFQVSFQGPLPGVAYRRPWTAVDDMGGQSKPVKPANKLNKVTFPLIHVVRV